MTHLSCCFAATLLPLSMIGSSLAEATPNTVKTDKSASANSPTTGLATGEQSTPQPGGYSNISNDQLQQMLDQGVTVIDIRREEEWRETGVIEGVTPLTFFTASGQLNPQFVPALTAATTAEQPLVLICRSGNRTRAASKAIAQHLGYQKVYNVTRGMKGWIGENRAVIAYP